MRPDDVAAVLEAQEPAAVAGLAEVFPQDRYPFPRDAVAARWRAELQDPDIDCFVIQRLGSVAGFAALRGTEVLHFGVALEEWGSGLAVEAHDDLVARIGTTSTYPWLRVYVGNARACVLGEAGLEDHRRDHTWRGAAPRRAADLRAPARYRPELALA